MSDYTAEEVRERVDGVYRSDSRRVLATLIRLLGDFDLAEEALHNAFIAAIEQWPRSGVPVKVHAHGERCLTVVQLPSASLRHRCSTFCARLRFGLPPDG